MRAALCCHSANECCRYNQAGLPIRPIKVKGDRSATARASSSYLDDSALSVHRLFADAGTSGSSLSSLCYLPGSVPSVFRDISFVGNWHIQVPAYHRKASSPRADACTDKALPLFPSPCIVRPGRRTLQKDGTGVFTLRPEK